MTISRRASCALLILGAACHTPQSMRPTTPDDAMLVEVSTAERSKIASARHEADQANDAFAAAKTERDRTGDRRLAADQRRTAAILVVDNAQSALSEAVARGTTSDIDAAKARVASAKASNAVHAARATLRVWEATHADQLVEVAQRHVAVAEAKVDLAKVNAVNTLLRPTAQKPVVADFELALRQAEADESVAMVKAEAALREINVATANLKACEDNAGFSVPM